MWIAVSVLSVLTVVYFALRGSATGQGKKERCADEICRIDPKKKIYYSSVDELSGVKEFDFEGYNLYLDGHREMKGGFSYTDRIIVGNDAEELKAQKAEILQKKIYDSSYPASIAIRLEIADEVMEFRSYFDPTKPRIIKKRNITGLYKPGRSKYEDGHWYGIEDAIFGVIEEDRSGDTTRWESPEEYDERIRTEALKAEEKRLEKILTQIDRLTK
ncbi:MAG: hypothetical protein J6Y37_09260 [Paludibacteraceae bacterium]|nr:hypothetical protein [Paludibacteraceae bacterium]